MLLIMHLALNVLNESCCLLSATKCRHEKPSSLCIQDMYMQAGLEEREMVLLLTDAQIIDEAFLEDINSLLHIGDVPGLLCPEDCECAVAAMREHLEALGKPTDKVLQKPAQHCKPDSTLVRLSCSECLQVPHACSLC